MKMQQEERAKTQWWLQQLCETDRKIVGKKRRDVQALLQQCLSSMRTRNSGSDTSRVVVPIAERSATPTDSDEESPARRLFPDPLELDWDPNYPAMESFYQRVSLSMASLNANATSEAAGFAEQTSIPEKDQVKQIGFDIKTLRTVMERELSELGAGNLHRMICYSCKRLCPSNYLYAIKVPSKKGDGRRYTTAHRCVICWRGPYPSRNLFELLIKEIAEQWAKMVGRRVECLYGDWHDMLSPMVRMLKENVLLADDIAALLRTCVEPEEFGDVCEVIIVTTIVFYLQYVDFRRSCEAMMALKPTVTHAELFEIFSIYFPNRAKGIKTGDFL